ncbi:MAG TPA: hypothetical protein VMC79_09165 [Rectinemataceae bacterium]|nr:hypothetical protein [Rectinemataceae bacterium]
MGVHCLHLRLPGIPDSWAVLSPLCFRLSWRGPSGTVQRQSAMPGSTLDLVLPRGRFQALLAEPLCRGRALRPAGALYPLDLDSGSLDVPAGGAETLRLSWLGGYLASVARELEASGLDPAAFNLTRLKTEVERRIADPWSLPATEVARRLAEGSFRADALRDPKLFPVELPGPGPWAAESPFARAPALLDAGAGSPGALYGASLPAGISLFLSRDLDLMVFVDEAGAARWVRLFAQSPGP